MISLLDNNMNRNEEDRMCALAPALKILNLTIEPNQRLIIIGDIHGCYDEFINLLLYVNYDKNNDIIVSVGDLITKGPESSNVLNLFIQNKNCYAVMGNHEYCVNRWVEVFEHDIKSLPVGLRIGSEHESLAKLLTNEQINYLRNLPHILRIDCYNLIVVHAGINPTIDIDKNNVFDVTHIRNILPDGSTTESTTNGVPWIDLWNGDKIIIFGHDASRGIQKTHNAIGLDTGCTYGKYLTCVIYPGEKIVSVPAIH